MFPEDSLTTGLLSFTLKTRKRMLGMDLDLSQKKGIVYVSAGTALLFIYYLQLFRVAMREHFLLDPL